MCGKPLKEKEWEPEVGKWYYYIGSDMIDFIVMETVGANYGTDVNAKQRSMHSKGLLFDIREAAEKHLAMVKCVDSQRELPKEYDTPIVIVRPDLQRCFENWKDDFWKGYLFQCIMWRLGFAQPDTPEGRALLEKNIREHKEWWS